MEPFEHDSDYLDDASPYQDYYSTGGQYRPPRKPRNHGWIAATLGVLLLCVTAGATLARENRTAQPQVDATPQPSPTTTEITSGGAQEQAEVAVSPAPAQDSDTVLGTGAVLTISESTGEEMALPDIYKKVIPSVVSISAISGSSTSTGTGIIMSSDGYIITNYHVVSSAQQIVVLLTDGQEYNACQVGGDETSDIMVLKINATDLTPAEFGDSDAAEVGDSVVAIGDPLGIELRGTMTDGIICGIKRDVDVGDRTMSLMQTNAALNSGNSGGPLVNMEGQVIGINTIKLSSSGYTTVEGLGFAIPIDSAKPIVDELVEKGYVTGRPAFGFDVEQLESRISLYYDLPGKLYIRSVESSSDAYAQGIRAGDIITAIDGQSVSTVDEFNRIKNEYSAGDQIPLTIFRSGHNYDVTVTLMDRADLD